MGSRVETVRHRLAAWPERSGERKKERDPQRVLIGAGIGALPGPHFGCRVIECPDETSGLGHGLLPGESRGPEVREEGAPVRRDQDVLRLDVAMQDAAPVGGVERAADLAPHARRGVAAERPVPPDMDREVRAVDELHHHEAPGTVVYDVVRRDDIRMADLTNRLHLTPQSLARELGGRRWGD